MADSARGSGATIRGSAAAMTRFVPAGTSVQICFLPTPCARRIFNLVNRPRPGPSARLPTVRSLASLGPSLPAVLSPPAVARGGALGATATGSGADGAFGPGNAFAWSGCTFSSTRWIGSVVVPCATMLARHPALIGISRQGANHRARSHPRGTSRGRSQTPPGSSHAPARSSTSHRTVYGNSPLSAPPARSCGWWNV